MDLLGLGTLILAATALGTLIVAYWQMRVMRRQTLLSAVGESTFREARMPEWWEARDWIFEHLTVEPLPDKYAPHHGISDLPPPARAAIRKIGFLYDNLGLLVVRKVVPEDLVIGFFGEGMQRQWKILEPYINEESEKHGVDYMVFFRALVCRSRRHPAAEYQRKWRVRWLDAHGRTSPATPSTSRSCRHRPTLAPLRRMIRRPDD